MADYAVELLDNLYEITVDPITTGFVDSNAIILEMDVFTTKPVQSVVNRVWDTVAADFVRWVTSAIDSTGTFYPGPGTFGVDTSDFVVETIQHTRV